MAFDNSLAVGSKTFLRQTNNQFIEDSADLNLPDLLIIQNRNLLNNNGQPAQITVKRDTYKDSATVGVGDFRLQLWTTIQIVPGQFTVSEVSGHFADINTLLTTSGYMAKLMRGET